MLEQLMFLAMGFLAGAVVMLAFMPAVHERAVRLTARRLVPRRRPRWKRCMSSAI